VKRGGKRGRKTAVPPSPPPGKGKEGALKAKLMGEGGEKGSFFPWFPHL